MTFRVLGLIGLLALQAACGPQTAQQREYFESYPDRVPLDRCWNNSPYQLYCNGPGR